ncbi:MAG: hypothetical protein HYZ53_07685 [Planctomycetes bacterium]|nr:hypothetical protein [Planctomycetota bacterium]
MDLQELSEALGRPAAPASIRQQQFDGNQDSLERLARAGPRSRPRAGDLVDYALDLSYVAPLDPDLMRRALPLCATAWRRSLDREDASAFSEQFHAALARRPRVIAHTLGPEADEAFRRFMAASLLERMSRETVLRFEGQRATPYVWIRNLVQYGRAWPDVERILVPWRALDTRGYAVCAVQYLSVLAYGEKDNPIFHAWTRVGGGGPPCLWEGASIGFGERWTRKNVAALRAQLDRGGACKWAMEAAERLAGGPGQAAADGVARDLAAQARRVRGRVRDLLRFLGTPSAVGLWEWTDARSASPAQD